MDIIEKIDKFLFEDDDAEYRAFFKEKISKIWC